jgi:hypothetical protein
VSLRQRESASWLLARSLPGLRSANVRRCAARRRALENHAMITIDRRKWQRRLQKPAGARGFQRKHAGRSKSGPLAYGRTDSRRFFAARPHFTPGPAAGLAAAPPLARAGGLMFFMAGSAAFLNSAAVSTNGKTFFRRPDVT